MDKNNHAEESYFDDREYAEMHSSRLQSWSRAILTEKRVNGPLFSPDMFKLDIDEMCAKNKNNDDDIDLLQQSPYLPQNHQQLHNQILQSQYSSSTRNNLNNRVASNSNIASNNNNNNNNSNAVTASQGRTSPITTREVIPKTQQRPSILISHERAMAFEQFSREHLPQSMRSSQSSNDFNEDSGTPSSSKVNSRSFNMSEFGRAKEEFERLDLQGGGSGVGSSIRKNIMTYNFNNEKSTTNNAMFSSLQQQQDRMFLHNSSLSPTRLNRIDSNANSGRMLTLQPITSSAQKQNSLQQTNNATNSYALQSMNNISNINNNLSVKQPSVMEPSFREKSQVAGSEMNEDQQIRQGFQGVWAKSAFQILTLTKKFITNIKELSMKFKFSQMRESQFELIDDVSTSYTYYSVRGYLKNDTPGILHRAIDLLSRAFNRTILYIPKNEKSQLKICLSKSFRVQIGVMLPDSFIKIAWDCLILFLLCMNIFYIPMKIAFDSLLQINEVLYMFFDDLPTWAFVADIFLNFNTATYSKGVISSERSKIFKHYIRESLYWDILIIGPFLFSSFFNVQFLNIILLLRYSKILKIVSSIEELLNLRQSQATVMSLLKLILTIIYVAHICGCFFYYMHVLQVESDPTTVTWVVRFELDGSGWLSLYVSSVYWAVITMITLGYGDIYPVTTVEKVYVIMVTMASCGVFAYAVNQIGYIIQEMTKRSVSFRSNMSSLTNHMRQRQLSNVMQMRVRKYFEYLHHEEQEDNEVGQKMLGKCHNLLKKEVLTEMYGQILSSRKEFRLNFSKEFLLKLAPKMRESRIGPEETIFKENEHNKRVYILMRGNVALQRTRSALTNEESEKQKIMNIKILKKGDVCGLESFLSNSESMVSAKSLNVVSLVSISKDDFQQVLSEFKDDKERYAMMKDKLNLQKTYRGLGINCFLCDSYTHQFLNCPYMSYQPNQKKVIHQYQLSQMQDRAKRDRKPLHTPKTISQTLGIQETAIKILFENNPYETIHDLLEQIQVLEDEGALQINTPEVLSKYIKDPQEFNDLDDIHGSQEIDEFIRMQLLGDQGKENNQGSNQVNDDSVRIRRATVGSTYRPEKEKTPEIYSIATNNQQAQYIKRGSMRIMRSSTQNIDGYLEPFTRPVERKSSFRKQTMFSDHDKVYIFKNKEQSPGQQNSGDGTPSRKFFKQESMNIEASENINNNTQSLSHHFPGTPQQQHSSQLITLQQQQQQLQQSQQQQHTNQPGYMWPQQLLERSREKSISKLSKAGRMMSLRDEEESINTPYQNPMNSQISNYQLDYVSVKSSKSNRIGGPPGAAGGGPPNDDQLNATSYYPAGHAPSSQMIIKDFMSVLKFEKAETWSLYFPHNNLAVVLSSNQKLLERRLEEQTKRKRKNRHHHSVKMKNVQKIFSSIQARNVHKRQSSKFVRSQRTKQSYISNRESQMNPFGLQGSQLLSATMNDPNREPSRSMLSSLDANSEMPLPHSNIEPSQ